MRCSNCGGDAPAGGRFCMNCGSPLSPEPQARREGRGSAPSNRKRLGILAALAAAVIIGLIILLLTLLQGGEKVATVRPLPGNAQSPVLDTDRQPPFVDVPSENPPPPEVVAYLNHVKQTETQRQSMRLDLTPAFEMLKKAHGMKTESDDQAQQQTRQDISGGIDQYTQQWQQIVEYFNSVQAPSGCEQLGSAYSQALGKYSAAMISINYAMNTQDIGALMQLQNSAQADVDVALLQADHELATVCNTYGIPKDFTIQPDKSMSPLLSPGP